MILGIDTSTRRRVLAVLVDASGAVADRVRLEDVATASGITSALKRLTDGDKALDAVVVAVGPGSYTGIRSGMAAALGLAHARGVKLFGAGSLDVIAHASSPDLRDFRVAVDAGRGGAFVADYTRTGTDVAADAAARRIPVEDLVEGDGRPTISSAAIGDCLFVDLVDPLVGLCRASLAASQGTPLDPLHLAAVYVAPPIFAEIPKNARV